MSEQATKPLVLPVWASKEQVEHMQTIAPPGRVNELAHET